MTPHSSRLTPSAAMRKFSAVSSMSGTASAVYGLPCSSESSRANSSVRSSIKSAIAWQTFARSHAESAAHLGWASRAALAARRMSSSLAFGASASFSPVTGETITRASSLVASTQSPATKFCSVLTVVATSHSCSRIDTVPRLVEHLAQDSDHLVELLRPGDEGRGELRARLAAVVEAHVDPELPRPRKEEPLDQLVPLGRGEGLLRLLVLDELERVEVAVAAHVADHRVLLEQDLAALPEAAHVLLHASDEVFSLEDRQVRQRDGAGERMAAEGDPVGEGGLLLGEEGLARPLVRDDGAERRPGRGDALGEGHHVRLDPVARRAEPVAHPAEAADDLVGHEQQAVLVADLAHALEVAVRRRDRPGRVLHRLEDDRSDGVRSFVHDD